MNIPYALFLVTFIAHPIISSFIANRITASEIPNHKILLLISIFLLHNLLFYLKISLRGDFIDYFIFSTEYLAFCIAVSLLYKIKSIGAKILRTFGTIIIVLGCILGTIGILMFIVISQDYDADKKFTFESNGDTYETRRYSFGFATLDAIRYSFETYRTYPLLFLERKVDTTRFFDTKTDLNISEPNLKINIIKNGGIKHIVFKSTNGHNFTKVIR